MSRPLANLAELLKAIAHERKLEILKVLIEHKQAWVRSSDIAGAVSRPAPETSGYLTALAGVGILFRKVSGRSAFYSFNPLARQQIIEFFNS